MSITFTNILLDNPQTGGKHYDLQDGELRKKTVGWISSGRAYVDSARDMRDFADLLNHELVPGRNVLTYGIPIVDVGKDGIALVTKVNARAGAITRSESDFEWPNGPGILAADYDPREGYAALTREELWAQVTDAVPGYAKQDVIWGCSSSSFIYNASGHQLVGIKGQRLYIGAEDATDIPRAADVMLKRFWLSGHGFIFISGCGSQLVRSTFDNCMYQASRIDYAAGAVCAPMLEQRRPDAVLISEGIALANTRELLPDLTPDEESEFQRLVSQAKADAAGASLVQRAYWARDQIFCEARKALGDGATERQVLIAAEALAEAGRRKALMGLADTERPVLDVAHILHLSDGTAVTVGDVLRSAKTFHGKTTADPLEPDYRGGAITGILYPYHRRLVSQAHGQQRTYILGTDAQYRAIWATVYNQKMIRPARLEDSREQRIAKMMETQL
tara:strand:- start:8340 stop:9683 length:1344 start_codon:yes stop_codon:yes gene_type:complete